MSMRMPRNLGMTLLAAFLILFGVFSNSFLKIEFSYARDILAILAVIAGVLLFMQR